MKRIALVGLGALAFFVWFLIIGHRFEYQTVPEMIMTARPSPSPSPVLRFPPYSPSPTPPRSVWPYIADPKLRRMRDDPEMQRKCQQWVTGDVKGLTDSKGKIVTLDEFQRMRPIALDACKEFYGSRGY